MVEYNPLDSIFSSLADPTRRDILRRLRSKEQSVGELAARYDLTYAAISKHLQVLERAQLVRKSRKGRKQQVELVSQSFKKADAYLEQYRKSWGERLDRLEMFLQAKE